MSQRPYLDFKTKWEGNKVDYDHCYGYQCVDLIKQYMEECLKLGKIGSLGNAKAIPNSPVVKKRDKFKITTTNLRQWDIVVRTQGTYGHVAIVDRVAGGKVYVLEQNGSGKNSGNGEGANAIRVKDYKFWFYDTALRCSATTKNFNSEKQYVLDKIKERQKLLDDTIEYYRSITGNASIN